MRGRLLRCMSPPGVQGEGHHFENLLHLLRNFERLTTCRHDMPYVVAYVVPDVVVSGVECLLSPVADMPHCTRWTAMGHKRRSWSLFEEWELG